MPSPLLQLRIPQDLADWLEAKHPSRGEVAAYVRQLLTAEQMKEAVAPLVPCVALLENTSAVRTSAGGLQIEWQANGWDIEITFDKDGNPIGFYTEKC